MGRLIFTRNMVESMGQRLLETRPNAVVAYRLLRDVLRLPRGSVELETAHLQMHSHPWVEELEREQHPDGSWGHFHSKDSSLKTRFPTCEKAICRAVNLGLEKDSPLLVRVVDYMCKVLSGETIWSDRVEKSAGWPIIVEAVTAATLAEVDPAHPALRPVWEYWVEIATRSFPSGTYDPISEFKAHKDLRGPGTRYFGSRYMLTLLGARSVHLPSPLDKQVVDWIWKNPAGIGYLGQDLRHPNHFHIFHWLESLEILSQFQTGRMVGRPAAVWLWNQRHADGLWDFGTKVSNSFNFPLSDNWRKKGNRSVDHSTHVLALLRRFLD